MVLFDILMNFTDRFANAVNAARLTEGKHSLSAERRAQARRMMLEAPAETQASPDADDCAPVAMTAQKAA